MRGVIAASETQSRFKCVQKNDSNKLFSCLSNNSEEIGVASGDHIFAVSTFVAATDAVLATAATTAATDRDE